MNKDILLWSNIEILNALDKWGVLTVRKLHSLIYLNISIQGLRRKLHKLAKEDYLQISRLEIKNEMIVIPTKKTLNQLKSNRSSIDEAMIYHNFFLSLLGLEIISREKVSYFKLPHEYGKSRTPLSFSSSIEPDAFIGVCLDGKNLKVAIEIELTQKSSDRVYEKFNQYNDSLYFDYVIYFFKDLSIASAYRKRLDEMSNELKNEGGRKKLRGKIIFLYSAQNHQSGSILDNSKMECLGKEISIEKFLGPSISIIGPINKTITK